MGSLNEECPRVSLALHNPPSMVVPASIPLLTPPGEFTASHHEPLRPQCRRSLDALREADPPEEGGGCNRISGSDQGKVLRNVPYPLRLSELVDQEFLSSLPPPREAIAQRPTAIGLRCHEGALRSCRTSTAHDPEGRDPSIERRFHLRRGRLHATDGSGREQIPQRV